MSGFLQIPEAALDLATDWQDRCIVFGLYELADANRYEPFKAASRMLRSRFGNVSGRRVEAMMSALMSAGLVVLVTPGTPRNPRVLRVLRWKEWANGGEISVPSDDERNAGGNAGGNAADLDEKVEQDAGESVPADPAGNADGNADGNARRARSITKPQTSDTKNNTLSNSATAESDPDTLTKTWEALQAIRKRHQPAARGQSLSAARRRNLRARLSELRKAGHDRGALLHAAEWVHTSANMRAMGAQNTGDPLGTLLRARNCLDYVELAIGGNTGPAASATDGADLAWQQILTMTRRGDLAERIRSGRLGPDATEHGRRLAAIKAVGGFPVFRSLDNFTERKTRDGFRAAYAGGAA